MLELYKSRARKTRKNLLIAVILFFLLSIPVSFVKAHRLSVVIEKANFVTSLRPECPIIDTDLESIELLTLLGPTYPAGNVSFEVYDPDGFLYAEGRSDYYGRFSFELPIPAKPGMWRIVAKYEISPPHTAVLDFYLERSIIAELAPEGPPPVYMIVIAIFGYALGIVGMVIGYIGWRAKKGRR